MGDTLKGGRGGFEAPLRQEGSDFTYGSRWVQVLDLLCHETLVLIQCCNNDEEFGIASEIYDVIFALRHQVREVTDKEVRYVTSSLTDERRELEGQEGLF